MYMYMYIICHNITHVTTMHMNFRINTIHMYKHVHVQVAYKPTSIMHMYMYIQGKNKTV